MTESTRYAAPAKYPHQIIGMISTELNERVELERQDRLVSRSEILRDALEVYFEAQGARDE